MIPAKIITAQPEHIRLYSSSREPLAVVTAKRMPNTSRADTAVLKRIFGKTSPKSSAAMCRKSAAFRAAVIVHTIR